MPRVPTSAVLALLLALTSAACAGVPTSGPVRKGDPVRLERSNVAVPFIATPPQPGATPEEVVRGFLRASADFRSDHRVARMHLAPSVRQLWRTGASTTVYDQAQAPLAVVATGPVVTVRGAEVARIDAEGSYRRAPSEVEVTRTFRMARISGEWRITSLQDGLLLSLVDVQESFRQVSLYFLSPSQNTLVPDTVLLPELPGLSTRLVSRLLRGPTAAVRGGVVSAFPQGTGLEVPSVPIRDGLVTVRLDETALSADDDEREQMAAQLVWTVKQLGPEVQRVRITAGGRDLVVSGVAAEQPRNSWLKFDPNGLTGTPSVYVVVDGRVSRILEGRFEPVAGPAGSGSPALRSPAVSLDEGRVAAVSSDGTTLYAGRLAAAAAFDPVASGGDLGPPSWDPLGNLWFVDKVGGTISVLAAGATEPVAVQVGRRPGGPVTQIALSRDGVRVAMVTGSGRAARLLVATVQGVDQLGTEPLPAGAVPAVSIRAAREVLPDLRGIRDVAWADAQTLAVLGSRAGGRVEALYTSTDGYEVEAVQAEEDLAGLAAAPPVGTQISPLVVQTAEGLLEQFTSGRVWVQLGTGSDPAYPG